MKDEINRCTTCRHLVVKKDRNWVRYQCPFCPNKEFLMGMNEEEFVHPCYEYEPKEKEINA